MESSAPPELERRLQTRLEGSLHPSEGRILYVAYSGGGDSTALLVALVSLGYTVHALHVDHGWHPDSAQWAQSCQRQAAALGVPFTLLHLPPDAPGEGPEDQARRARYALMAAQLGQGDWLFTAQHLEDQAETLLLQLLRGAGVAGLAGMPWQRPLGTGLLIRPLLDVPQQVLRDYLEQWHLPFLNDPANADMRYDRVRVRNILLPQLGDLGWPHAAPNIARAADNLADMREIAADWFGSRWQQYRADYPELSVERLSLEYLQSLSAAAQRVFLRGWFQQRQIPVPSRERLEALRDAVMQRRGGARIQWEGGQAWLQGGLLRAWPQPRTMAEKEWEEGPWCVAQGDPLPISGWQCALRDTAPDGFHHALAERFAETSLYWRRRRQGELTLTGQGQHRPLKKLLLEAGVPPDRRADVPLLWDEAGHLLLILGYYTAPWASAPGGTALCLWNTGAQSTAGRGVGST
ncbi:tRNA lysidine(34) synthetase TilS [Acidithiobacillus ferriphilus]|uniref:tRNA(Ile)-lysidine synthase n=2 Tax=Acidithiobacillus TaxID=119977 RepID=A0A179BDE2_ACIFR|nr:tRNA lysidine(34) synthetase TilS [Acidithiobacillus ferriphilus]MDA8180994.1 tRNA lysidine(34) synthetase TilS [Acidithiobacillus sp.]OAP89726.1 tRNA(Ile)-lysidine synthetase [Acidithiobacillus ferrooxidans]MBU2854343.1 tRNA lysidine(34) synthetase TilS [Acidithiobacillus ferriphilus]MEB8490461.1 tRNA lysidine(34) synthetase TilS [Acidithiobacillus ferriphilus]MEB8494614.1 tRNA lysidine(34) synthetase TilS [Acidithiobacillus ferriphilus]